MRWTRWRHCARSPPPSCSAANSDDPDALVGGLESSHSVPLLPRLTRLALSFPIFHDADRTYRGTAALLRAYEPQLHCIQCANQRGARTAALLPSCRHLRHAAAAVGAAPRVDAWRGRREAGHRPPRRDGRAAASAARPPLTAVAEAQRPPRKRRRAGTVACLHCSAGRAQP